MLSCQYIEVIGRSNEQKVHEGPTALTQNTEQGYCYWRLEITSLVSSPHSGTRHLDGGIGAPIRTVLNLHKQLGAL